MSEMTARQAAWWGLVGVAAGAAAALLPAPRRAQGRRTGLRATGAEEAAGTPAGMATGAAFSSFLGGVAAGAGAAVLLAPVPGAEMRRRARQAVEERLETIRGRGGEAPEEEGTVTDQTPPTAARHERGIGMEAMSVVDQGY